MSINKSSSRLSVSLSILTALIGVAGVVCTSTEAKTAVAEQVETVDSTVDEKPTLITDAVSTEEAIEESNSNYDIATEIPAQFLGKWAFEANECIEDYAESRLIMEPTRISFFESAGVVTEVVTKDKSEITLTAELFSKGTTFSKTITFQLSSDGSSLTNTTQGMTHSVVRHRCAEF